MWSWVEGTASSISFRRIALGQGPLEGPQLVPQAVGLLPGM